MAVLLVRKQPHHLGFFNGPTPAQAKAGNYQKQHVTVHGMDVTIENPRGTMRSGVDDAGKPWRTGMQHHYGYIKRTLGVDGDHFDCFIGQHLDAPDVHVITTARPPAFTAVDEQKAMIGFPSAEAAKVAFHQHYDDPRFLRSMVSMPVADFRAKVMATREHGKLIKSVIGAYERRTSAGQFILVGPSVRRSPGAPQDGRQGWLFVPLRPC